MKYLFFSLLFVTSICYAQEKSIVIQLKSDSSITTNWIKLYDFPIFQQPYIKIKNTYNKKIRVRDIVFYKGYDQNGNFRYLKTIDFEFPKKYRFTERLFKIDSTQNVNIYYNQFTFGGTDFEFTSRLEHIKYSINSLPIKLLNYKNVSADLANCKESRKYLNGVKRIRLLQLLSAGLGVTLLTNQILNNSIPYETTFMNKANKMTLMASGMLLVLPFTLEKAKKNRLTKALSYYN